MEEREKEIPARVSTRVSFSMMYPRRDRIARIPLLSITQKSRERARREREREGGGREGRREGGRERRAAAKSVF
jgi:hypothetical protein